MLFTDIFGFTTTTNGSVAKVAVAVKSDLAAHEILKGRGRPFVGNVDEFGLGRRVEHLAE